MKAEYDFILNCLSDLCVGRSTECPENTINPEILFQLTNEQSLDSLIYVQCRKSISLDKAEAKFRDVLKWHVFYSVNRGDLLREIVKKLQAENISVICFKGSIFREYYPEPSLRTMGDMDLIIHHKDRLIVDKIMTEQIGCKKYIDNHAVWTYILRDFMFEIHDHMFYEELANQTDYQAYFDHVWEHCHHATVFGIEAENLYVPGEEFHFLVSAKC